MASSNEAGRSVSEEDPFYLEACVCPEIATRAAALQRKNKPMGLPPLDKNDQRPRPDGTHEPIHVEARATKSQQQPVTPTTIPTPPTPPNTANRGRSFSIPSGGDPNVSRSPETNALRDFRKVVSSRMKMCTVAKWVRNVPLPTSVERPPKSSQHVDEHSTSRGSALSTGLGFGQFDSSQRLPYRQPIPESQLHWSEDEHPGTPYGDGGFLSNFNLERGQVFEQAEDLSSAGDRQSVARPGGFMASRGEQPSFAKATKDETKAGLQKASKSLDSGCSTASFKHPVAL